MAPAGYTDFRPGRGGRGRRRYLYAAGSAAADAGGYAAMLVRYRP